MTSETRRPNRRVCLVGTGVIGSGWAARCLARGLDVVATDPAPGAADRLKGAVANAWPALKRVGLAAGASQARLSFSADLAEAVTGADFVQENAPEREDLKRHLLAQIDAVAPPELIIASSSSGLLPTRIQADCRHPQRVMIGHPFNPVYLLPLVELVGGAQTAPTTIARAMDFYRSLGMRPLHVRNEIEGYISDRLQEALWRENLHLVADGVATTAELDDAISYGPGLRWALMGTNLTFHLAGGDGGMKHMLQQFGPALKLPWTKLAAPELTGELIDRMIDGTKAQAAGRSVKDLERRRDEFLVRLLELLQDYWPAEEPSATEIPAAHLAAATSTDLPTMHAAVVQTDWVDYNGHMSEAYYVLVFGHTTDALLDNIGLTAEYRGRTGNSVYTVEAHISYLREVAARAHLRVTTQVLDVDSKRLHVFHTMYRNDDGAPVATEELLLVHVSGTEPRSAPFDAEVLRRLEALRAAQAALPAPAQAGRSIALMRH